MRLDIPENGAKAVTGGAARGGVVGAAVKMVGNPLANTSASRWMRRCSIRTVSVFLSAEECYGDLPPLSEGRCGS